MPLKCIKDKQPITLSCAEGERGVVYEGVLEFKATEVNLADVPQTQHRHDGEYREPRGGVALVAAAGEGDRARTNGIHHQQHHQDSPDGAGAFRRGEGAGCAPPDRFADSRLQSTAKTYFVDTLARGIAKIAAPHYPYPVIVRLSDFKSNEYAHLIGGAQFEISEENPMLGLRGASRYYSEHYRDGFALECRAIRKAREEIGFSNLIVMVPFCRTPHEADRVLAVMADHGLRRGQNGLQVYVMCEIPSNVILAEEFAQRFDGFSIGSNDLTQLILGVDRDSAELADLFDERDEAVKRMIVDVIERAHRCGTKVGICGQAPSNYPEFAAFLVQTGIDSISLNPDSFVATTQFVAATEKTLGRAGK